jgi:hypothetical protein
MTNEQTQKSRRHGRQRTVPGKTLSTRLGIPITDDEREEIHAYCIGKNVITSQWARRLILDAIRGDQK